VLPNFLQLVSQSLSHACEYLAYIMPAGAFYFLTEFNDHLKVASVLLDFVVFQDALASLLLYINVFFDIEKLLIDDFHFVTPLQRVKRSLKDLVLFCLFEQKLLLLIACWVKETDLRLFDRCLGGLLPNAVFTFLTFFNLFGTAN